MDTEEETGAGKEMEMEKETGTGKEIKIHIDEKQMTNKVIKIEEDLHILIQNISKLPTLFLTNNPKYTTARYRSILVNHISSINYVKDFDSVYQTILMYFMRFPTFDLSFFYQKS